MDHPIEDPQRQFSRLTQYRWRLRDLTKRYPSHNADWQALQDAVDAIDRAALHFGLKADWWWATSSWGGKVPPDKPPLGGRPDCLNGLDD